MGFDSRRRRIAHHTIEPKPLHPFLIRQFWMSAEEEFRPPAWVRDWDLVGLRRFLLSDGANMSYAEYASRYQSQLQVGMSEVKRLYLDTKFWIHFRDI
jgi:hypothetical protein